MLFFVYFLICNVTTAVFVSAQCGGAKEKCVFYFIFLGAKKKTEEAKKLLFCLFPLQMREKKLKRSFDNARQKEQ